MGSHRTNRIVVLIIAVAVLAATVAPTVAAHHEYEQSVWIAWGKTDLDVQIAHVQDPVVAQAIERAVEMWVNGISYWNPDLGDDLSIRVYWPDSGEAPPEDFDPDIVFVPQGFAAIKFGTGACIATAPMLIGWGSFIRVTSHEFGHCLGLTHVFNHGNEYSPGFDIMGSGDGDKCPSNLNVQVLEKAFAGQTGTIFIPSSEYAQSPTC